VEKVEPISGGRAMNQSKEAVCQLIVVRRDGPVDLQVVEYSLDPIELPVDHLVRCRDGQKAVDGASTKLRGQAVGPTCRSTRQPQSNSLASAQAAQVIRRPGRYRGISARVDEGSQSLSLAPTCAGQEERLQHALPDARILYVSATGATIVENLEYALRVGRCSRAIIGLTFY